VANAQFIRQQVDFAGAKFHYARAQLMHVIEAIEEGNQMLTQIGDSKSSALIVASVKALEALDDSWAAHNALNAAQQKAEDYASQV
jgi:hypothetical protein